MKELCGALYGFNGGWNPINGFKGFETVTRWKILLQFEAELGGQRHAFNHPDPCHEKDCNICAEVNHGNS